MGKRLEDGRYGALVPMLFGNVRLVVQQDPEDLGYSDSW